MTSKGLSVSPESFSLPTPGAKGHETSRTRVVTESSVPWALHRVGGVKECLTSTQQHSEKMCWGSAQRGCDVAAGRNGVWVRSPARAPPLRGFSCHLQASRGHSHSANFMGTPCPHFQAWRWLGTGIVSSRLPRAPWALGALHKQKLPCSFSPGRELWALEMKPEESVPLKVAGWGWEHAAGTSGVHRRGSGVGEQGLGMLKVHLEEKHCLLGVDPLALALQPQLAKIKYLRWMQVQPKHRSCTGVEESSWSLRPLYVLHLLSTTTLGGDTVPTVCTQPGVAKGGSLKPDLTLRPCACHLGRPLQGRGRLAVG